MKEKLKELFSNPWVILAAIAIAAAIVWFFIIPWIKGEWSNLQGDANILATGETPTLSESQAQGIADAIYNDCSTVWSNDFGDIQTQVGQINNDADLQLVIKEFGTRNWGTVLLLDSGSGSLTQFLRAFITPAQISQLNTDLASRGVKGQL